MSMPTRGQAQEGLPVCIAEYLPTLPIDGANCRVMLFSLGPATDGDLGPATDGATTCVKIRDDQARAKKRTRQPNAPGEKTPHPRI